MAQRNLYQYTETFELLIAGVWKQVDEPIGWDKIRINGERDKLFMGMNYLFVDPQITLSFPENEGGSMLRTEKELKGGDAQVSFRFSYLDATHNKITPYVGNLNFNEYRDNDEGVTCTVVKTVFADKLRTRMETKITLSSDKDLDGNAVTPCPSFRMVTHSQKIKRTGLANQAGDKSETAFINSPFPGNSPWWIFPDLTNIKKTEVKSIVGFPGGTDPVGLRKSFNYTFLAEETGEMQIRFTMAYDFNATRGARSALPFAPFASNINEWSLTPKIDVYDKDFVLKSSTAFDAPPAQITGDEHSKSLIVHHSFNVNARLVIDIGDTVYCYVLFVYKAAFLDAISLKTRIQNVISSVEVVQETIAPPSVTTMYNYYDAINYCVAAITGRAAAVTSSYIGPGGCWYKRAVTNGYQLRNFDVANKPVIVTLKQLLEDVNALANVGMQYSFNSAGLDILKLERVPVFFAGGRMFNFTEIFDYEDSHSKQFTFNAAEIGFEKFSEEESNTLDDIHTNVSFLLPITTFKATYEKKCKAVCSSYLIERQRREQFSENPSTSLNGDDDVYIICYNEAGQSVFKDVSFILEAPVAPSTNKTVTFINRTIDLPDDAIFFASAAGPPETFGIVRRVAFTQNKFEVTTAASVYGSYNSDITILSVIATAEKNENFPVANNLISPETTYNLALAPIFMVFQHASILNTALAYKADTEVIKNTFAKNNGDVELQWEGSTPCPPIPDNPVVIQKMDLTPVLLNNREAIGLPDEAKFLTPFAWADFMLLVQYLTGQTGTAEDYGNVAHLDHLGRWWESVILDFEYDAIISMLSVRVLKIRKL